MQIKCKLTAIPESPFAAAIAGLTSPDLDINVVRQAILELANAAFEKDNRDLLASTVQYIVPLLSSSDVKVAQYATGALNNLSTSLVAREAMVEHNAVAPLIANTRARDGDTQWYAVAALSNLAAVTEHAHQIAQAGGVSALIPFLKHLDLQLCEFAASGLAKLSQFPEGAQELMGALPRLVELLESPRSHDLTLSVAVALENIFDLSLTPSGRLIMAKSPDLPKVVQALTSVHPDVWCSANNALSNLTGKLAGTASAFEDEALTFTHLTETISNLLRLIEHTDDEIVRRVTTLLGRFVLWGNVIIQRGGQEAADAQAFKAAVEPHLQALLKRSPPRSVTARACAFLLSKVRA